VHTQIGKSWWFPFWLLLSSSAAIGIGIQVSVVSDRSELRGRSISRSPRHPRYLYPTSSIATLPSQTRLIQEKKKGEIYWEAPHRWPSRVALSYRKKCIAVIRTDDILSSQYVFLS
jgi:hypothetical protein